VAELLPDPSGPWLVERARRDPEGLALQIGDEALGWRELAARVETVAGRLVALGIAPGDRLAVLMEPSGRLVELVHAAQRCRVTLVPLNPRLAAGEVAVLLAHAEPAFVLHDRAHAATLTAARRSAPGRALEAQDELDAIASAAPPSLALVDPAAVQTILYTSGTTGRPKGVMLTYGNHRASADASRAHLGTSMDDRWLCALPLHHVGGLSIVMRSVLDGTPLVLHQRFDAPAVGAAVREYRITLLSLVPTMLHRLLEHMNASRAASLPSLRGVLVGGAALSPALHTRALACGIPVLPTYGLTESASQVATSALGEGPVAAGCVGRALSGTRLRIVGADAQGRGEVLVGGPAVMAGYFRDPAATAVALRDGWLHTGDIGRLDAEGRLQIFDRRTDVIISGGENVYPSEIEEVLLGHPAVAEAAIYGGADPEWGQRVMAAVVLRPGCEIDDAALQRWCRERLAGYKIPRVIVRVAALPRTASGKLQRHALAL
jgi:O-succinylbenzoic acid--CoA ligase